MKKVSGFIAMTLLATFAYGGVAFLKGERVSGMNKICYYDHLGSDVAITVSSVALCPLTINVP